MESLTVEHSLWIAAPREKTWHAVTETQQLKQWWGDNSYGQITTLQEGATIKFSEGENAIFAIIRVVDPPREFVFQWPPHPRYHSVPFTTRYFLEKENGGTRVTVSEAGFEALPDDDRQSRFERITEEYRMVMANLKAYLERTNL